MLKEASTVFFTDKMIKFEGYIGNLHNYFDMKRPIITAAAAFALTGAVAQNKLDVPAQGIMQAYETSLGFAPSTPGTARIMTANSTPAQVYTAVVMFNSPQAMTLIESLGIDVVDSFDDLAIIDLPLDKVADLTQSPYIDHVSFGGKATVKMDEARKASGVDAVHIGTGLEQAYTGDGVYVSLMDQGLDPNHINFMDQNGRTRVEAIDKISGSSGTETRYVSSSQIAGFTTDTNNSSHGTHVLGMITGAYKGNVTAAKTEKPNPFYGVAPDARILVGCGDLYNNNVVKLVKYVHDIAVSEEVPAVINLSLGVNTGTHDASSSFNKTLDRYGENVIICIAAGNEGDIPMGVRKVFTADDNILATGILPHIETPSGVLTSAGNFTGQVDFFASNSTPFKLTVAMTDRNGDVTTSVVFDKSTSGRSTKVTYANLPGMESAYTTESYFNVSTNVDTASKRYGATITFNLDNTAASARNHVAFIIEGTDGQAVNGYINGSSYSDSGYKINGQFTDFDFEEWVDGSGNGSINDLACGKNIICVGSWTSRKTWPSYKGSNQGYTYLKVGDISDFSSYGTLTDGRNLPHITAPGCYVVSSWNKYNIDRGISTNQMGAQLLGVNNRDHWWGPMQGTSMATPFAAGVFALWLEADPTLTVADIRDIAQKTAIRDNFVTSGDPVRWGAGKLDALAGIKEVIARANAGVDNIAADPDSRLIVEQTADAVTAYLGGADSLTATLYNLAGQTVATATAQGPQATVSTAGQPSGVYILRADSRTTSATTKIIIR